jgi:hypothetical protein
MEDLSDTELHRLQQQFESLRKTAEAERTARTRESVSPMPDRGDSPV